MSEIQFKSESDVQVIQKSGGDHTIVAAAKVCTSGEEATQFVCPSAKEGNEGLIRYLMRHRHGTPFEHTFMTFFVRTPIFVWREWHRHRIGFSYNEESARYKKLDPVFYLPPKDRPMFKVDDWKPGRPKFTSAQSVSEDAAYNQLVLNLFHSYQHAYDNYERNLALNVDPGLARDCLPVGIFSSCWVSCNARSIMSFLSLRTHDADAKFISYPLYEIEQAARKLEAAFAEAFPITHQAFCEFGRCAP